jgi:hypothetical protein
VSGEPFTNTALTNLAFIFREKEEDYQDKLQIQTSNIELVVLLKQDGGQPNELLHCVFHLRRLLRGIRIFAMVRKHKREIHDVKLRHVPIHFLVTIG